MVFASEVSAGGTPEGCTPHPLHKLYRVNLQELMPEAIAGTPWRPRSAPSGYAIIHLTTGVKFRY